MAEPKAEPLAVTTPSGKTGYINPALAEVAGQSGAHAATDAELRAAQRSANADAHAAALQSRYDGTIEGEYGPKLAGAARGLTMGLSDPAILATAEALGGVGAREGVRRRLLDYKEFAPITSATSELGAVAGAAAMGDEAGLVRAPGALRAIARAAVEGGAYGAGSTISEASLENHALTGEALLIGAGTGALLGGATAGLLHGAGKSAGAAATRGPAAAPAEAFESLAGRAYGEAAPGVGRELAAEVGAGAKASKAGAFDAVADAYAGARSEGEAAKLREVWANHKKVFAKHEETVEGATREFSGALNDVLRTGRKVDMASFGDAKIRQVANIIDRSKYAEQAAAARAWLAEADEAVSALRPGDGFTATDAKQWRYHVQKVEAALAKEDGVALHSSLDNMKRFSGQQADFGRSAIGLNPAAKQFDQLYKSDNGIQKLLESDVWGSKLGAAQAEVNAATNTAINEGGFFKGKFTTKYGSDAGRPTYTADTHAVNGFFNRLTSAGNDLDAKAVTDYVASRRQQLAKFEQHYTYDAATSNAIKEERAALDKLDAVHTQTTKDVALANQVKQALEQERAKGIGGMIGLVTDVASKPYTMMQRLAALEHTTKSVVSRAEAGVGALVGGGEKAPGLAPPKATSGGGFFTGLLSSAPLPPERPVRAVAVAGAMKLRAEYTKTAQQVSALASNPAMVSDRVSRAVSPAAEGLPKVTSAATMAAVNGVQFLQSKLPPSRADQFSLQPQLQQQQRASDAEMAKFMRYVKAVDHPLLVLTEAKNGTLSRDHVEAVKAVYPELYGKMQQQVMTSMVDSKKELPYARRVQLGILLDIPTDKTLSPEFISAVQATYAPSEKAGTDAPPPTLSKPIHVSAPMMTATQSATQEGTEK